MKRKRADKSEASSGAAVPVPAAEPVEQHVTEVSVTNLGRLKAASILAGGFAHDINNLMSVILGNVDLLQQDLGEQSNSRDRLWTIEQSAKRVARMAGKMLAFSRQGGYNPRPLQLNPLVDETLTLCERTLPPGFQMIRVLRAAPDIVSADPALLQQLVVHLVHHAVELMHTTGGQVFVSTSNRVQTTVEVNGTARPRTDSCVALTIRDDGPGLDEAALEHQESAAGGESDGNSPSLSLRAARELVRRQGGRFEILAEPGRGSTVHVLLPAAEIIEEPELDLRLPPTVDNGLILVVDDEAGIRQLLTDLLQRAGFTVLTACNGREGLAKLEQSRETVNLVLLDLLMPEMDGAAMLEVLSREYPGLPVILISGNEQDERVDSLLHQGAQAFIHKPFELGQVLHAVRAVLADVVK